MPDQETPPEKVSQEPAAPASAAPEKSTPSQEYVSKADLEAFGTTLVDQIVPRITKSQRDTIQARVSSEVNEKLSKFDEAVKTLRPLMRDGIKDEDIAQIKEREFIRNLMADSSSKSEVEPETPTQVETPVVATTPPGLQDEIQSILEANKVSGDEPELKEFLEKNRGKRWFEIGQGFNDLAKSIAARSAGTPSGVVTSQGQVVTSDLVAEFRTELAEGMKQGRHGMRFLRQLQQKYVEKGANIDDLDISPKDSVKTREYLYAKDGPR